MKSFENALSKIYLADCLDALQEINDESINLIFADPPYNIGKKFGNLTIVSDIFFKPSKRGKQQSWVKCKCNCGNIIEVATNNLGTGNTKSCGCISSFGEQKIIKILIDNNINFSTQYSFSDLIGPKGGRLKFDFAPPRSARPY